MTFLLVAHFSSPAPDEALQLLADQATCRSVRFARSTDIADRYVLVAEFASVRDYRQALSPFDVRSLVIPWLSTALAGSGVNEVLLTAEPGRPPGAPLERTEPTVTPN